MLESQQLIHIKPVRAVTSGSSSSSRAQYMWHLSPAPISLTSPSPTPRTPSPSSDPETPDLTPGDLWTRLLSGEHPGRVSAHLQAVLSEREKAAKERLYASGKAKRPEREVWEWEGREMELTTRLERGHLSKRRARARPKKERRLMAARKQMERESEEVRKIAEREIKAEEGDRGREGETVKSSLAT